MCVCVVRLGIANDLHKMLLKHLYSFRETERKREALKATAQPSSCFFSHCFFQSTSACPFYSFSCYFTPSHSLPLSLSLSLLHCGTLKIILINVSFCQN